MKYSVQTAPILKPVSVEQAKEHMRIDWDNEDNYISPLVDAAILHVENFTRRKLQTQTIDYYLDAFPVENEINLPFGNLQSVTYVQYTESDDTVSTFDSDNYTVDTDGNRIVLDYGEVWPTETLATSNPVHIRYICGWGEGEVPDPICHAIKLLVAHLYENRESTIVGQTISNVPMAFDALLWPYRLWSFGK